MTLSESLLQATLEAIDDGVLVVDLANNIVSFNRRLVEMWQLSLELLETRNEITVLHAMQEQLNDSKHYGVRLQSLYSKPEVESRDVFGLNDGRVIECHSKPQLIGKEIVGRVWFFRDNTERRRAEQEANRLIRDRLLILDSTFEGIYCLDHQGLCIFMNQEAARMLGRSPNEVLGTNPHELFHFQRADESPYPIVECPIHQLHKNGVSRRVGKDVYWRTDGTLFPIEWAACSIMDEGRIKGEVITFLDITEKTNLESQLMRSQRLEAIGNLSGSIAHELNNILTPIILSEEMLHNKNHPLTIELFLDTIRSCAHRGADIVRQILTYSRSVASKHVIIQSAQVINEAVLVVKATFPKNISFHITAEKNLWPIIADPTQIQQIILNLCINARDAMSAGGQLIISVKNVMVFHTPKSVF